MVNYFIYSFLLIISVQNPVKASMALANYEGSYSNSAYIPLAELQKRESPSFGSFCGYTDGDANRPRTAPSGYICRTDTTNGFWGLCPITVAASNCGMPGACYDSHNCTRGCGSILDPGITESFISVTW